MPTFNYFKINKSVVNTGKKRAGSTASKDANNAIMICFIDISQKILYDTSKAEGELLSLINSTISHEMRNPLNSIINNCKILNVIMQQFAQLLQVYAPQMGDVFYK